MSCPASRILMLLPSQSHRLIRSSSSSNSPLPDQSIVPTMCSCAPLPHPPFKPAPAPHPNLNPKPNANSAHGPTRLRCAVVARAAARDDPPPAPSSFDFLALKRELEEQEEAVVAVDAAEGGRDEVNEEGGEREPKRIGSSGRRTGRQMARRSGLLAKQVISVSSARSLGFVSQLWVDASSWVVALVEVRPSLLSGDADKFLFEDIYQVGDVVLVEDESVVENEFKLIGLHGLVGYNVVTSRWRNVAKVRGFTFNINSGAVESLELDSFGLTIVPASLVSTYCLFVEDVLDIVSDTIVVHEDAISRVQRLTQGIWGTQNIQGPGDQRGEYNRHGRRRARSVKRQNSQGMAASQPNKATTEWVEEKDAAGEDEGLWERAAKKLREEDAARAERKKQEAAEAKRKTDIQMRIDYSNYQARLKREEKMRNEKCQKDFEAGCRKLWAEEVAKKEWARQRFQERVMEEASRMRKREEEEEEERKKKKGKGPCSTQ